MAQEAPVSAAVPFIRIERNPRSAAWAGAGRASVAGASAYSAFQGASQLPFLAGTMDAALGIQLWEPGNAVDKTTNFGGGAALHFGSFGVALGGAYQMGQPLSGGYRPSDRLVSLGLAYGIAGRVSLGFNLRYAGQSLAAGTSVNSFSMDISALGSITKELSATLGIQGLGPMVKGSVADLNYPLPSCVYAGLAWRHNFAADHTVEAVLDGEYNFDGRPAGALGAEYAFRKLLFVRAGYRLASASAVIPSHLALGIGFCFSGFRADVTYLTASSLLGNTVNIGIGYSF